LTKELCYLEAVMMVLVTVAVSVVVVLVVCQYLLSETTCRDNFCSVTVPVSLCRQIDPQLDLIPDAVINFISKKLAFMGTFQLREQTRALKGTVWEERQQVPSIRFVTHTECRLKLLLLFALFIRADEKDNV
jgi:hypothetical protein